MQNTKNFGKREKSSCSSVLKLNISIKSKCSNTCVCVFVCKKKGRDGSEGTIQFKLNLYGYIKQNLQKPFQDLRLDTTYTFLHFIFTF